MQVGGVVTLSGREGGGGLSGFGQGGGGTPALILEWGGGWGSLRAETEDSATGSFLAEKFLLSREKMYSLKG